MSAVKRTGCCKRQLQVELGTDCGDCHLKCVAVWCNVMQCVATCCNMLQCAATCGGATCGDCHLKLVQKGAVCCSVVQNVQPVPTFFAMFYWISTVHITVNNLVFPVLLHMAAQGPHSYTRTVGTDPTQLHREWEPSIDVAFITCKK